jgi:peptidoglycan/xylan/chitin deacetylase (PgdA/CDA1 family)
MFQPCHKSSFWTRQWSFTTLERLQKGDTTMVNPARLDRIRLVTVLTLSLVFFSALRCAAVSPPPQITIVFRYDDYSSRSATDLERHLIATFQKHGVCCTFGIIPFVKAVNYLDVQPQAGIPLTTAKAEMARNAIKAGAMDAAQHGYSHQTLQSQPGGWHTSYAGLDYDSQLYKIKTGKVFLDEMLHTKIITFIPPFNSYDPNTLKALENLDFQCLSANLSGETATTTSLRILPATCTLAQIREVIHYAREIIDYHPMICVLFHQYDFIGTEHTIEAEKVVHKISLQEFDDLVSWITSQNDLRVRSISQLLADNVDLSMERFRNNKYYLELFHLKPAWWPPHYGIYLPDAIAYNLSPIHIFTDISALRIKNILYLCSFYLLLLLIVFIATYLLSLLAFTLSGKLDKICKVLSSIIGCGLILYLILGERIEYQKIRLMVSALGVSLGAWSACYKRKKSLEPRGSKDSP